MNLEALQIIKFRQLTMIASPRRPYSTPLDCGLALKRATTQVPFTGLVAFCKSAQRWSPDWGCGMGPVSVVN